MTAKDLETIITAETKKLEALRQIFDILEDLDDDSKEWILERLTE